MDKTAGHNLMPGVAPVNFSWSDQGALLQAELHCSKIEKALKCMTSVVRKAKPNQPHFPSHP